MIKNSLFIVLVFLATSCASKTKKTLPADTEITVDNAKQVTAFDNTPESVVMFFYASRIRKDNAWEKVCLPANERSERMVRKLEDYSKWTITKYRFVDKEEFEKDKWWVKIYMSVTVEGETDDGEDEATVEIINGKCVVTEVPT